MFAADLNASMRWQLLMDSPMDWFLDTVCCSDRVRSGAKEGKKKAFPRAPAEEVELDSSTRDNSADEVVSTRASTGSSSSLRTDPFLAANDTVPQRPAAAVHVLPPALALGALGQQGNNIGEGEGQASAAPSPLVTPRLVTTSRWSTASDAGFRVPSASSMRAPQAPAAEKVKPVLPLGRRAAASDPPDDYRVEVSQGCAPSTDQLHGFYKKHEEARCRSDSEESDGCMESLDKCKGNLKASLEELHRSMKKQRDPRARELVSILKNFEPKSSEQLTPRTRGNKLSRSATKLRAEFHAAPSQSAVDDEVGRVQSMAPTATSANMGPLFSDPFADGSEGSNDLHSQWEKCRAVLHERKILDRSGTLASESPSSSSGRPEPEKLQPRRAQKVKQEVMYYEHVMHERAERLQKECPQQRRFDASEEESAMGSSKSTKPGDRAVPKITEAVLGGVLQHLKQCQQLQKYDAALPKKGEESPDEKAQRLQRMIDALHNVDGQSEDGSPVRRRGSVLSL